MNTNFVCFLTVGMVWYGILKEREEESKKLKQQRIIEEAEQRRLASEYQKRKEERVRREIEEKESEEANSLLQQEAERIRKGKKAKNHAIERVCTIHVVFMSNLPWFS